MGVVKSLSLLTSLCTRGGIGGCNVREKHAITNRISLATVLLCLLVLKLVHPGIFHFGHRLVS